MEKSKNKITKDKIEIKVRQLKAELMTVLPQNQNKYYLFNDINLAVNGHLWHYLKNKCVYVYNKYHSTTAYL